MITDYQLIQTDDPHNLMAQVRHGLANGWQPYGDMLAIGMTASSPLGLLTQPKIMYLQVMVRAEDLIALAEAPTA